MLMGERHQQILKLIEEQGQISTSEIQRRFRVTYATAQRDLVILQAHGQLKRTHGGALPLHQVAQGKPSGMTCRDIGEVKPNYMAIAEKAVSMIENNDVVFIISATVGYFMAQKIPADIKLRVVTNSIIVAEELRLKENVTVILLGGEMDNKGNFYDAFAVDMLKRLRFDKCFITSAAISPSFGLSIQRSGAIAFWNAVMDSSREVIGLYPTEKLGFDSVVCICPASRLDKLIGDEGMTEEDYGAFNELGIEVILADSCAGGNNDTDNADDTNDGNNNDTDNDNVSQADTEAYNDCEADGDGVTDTTCKTPPDTENDTSNPAKGNP